MKYKGFQYLIQIAGKKETSQAVEITDELKKPS